MLEPMPSEDVPDELVRMFDEASMKAAHVAMGVSPTVTEQAYMRGGLAAVLPAHEAMVRAKVAAELHARADAAVPGTDFKCGLRAAAHYATTPTVEDAARALQAMYEQHIARGEGQSITGLTCPTCGNVAHECICLEDT